MKATIITSAMALALMTIATAGFSQTKTPVVNEKQVNQQKRIGQGVKSGELTAGETKALEAREVKIQQDKKEAKADGTVTKAERTQLRKEQRRSSKAIARQKHDAQTRP